MVTGPTRTAVNLTMCVLFMYIKGVLGSRCANATDTIPSSRMCSNDITSGVAVLVHTSETTEGATCTCKVMTSSPTNISVTSFSDVSDDINTFGALSLRPRWTDTSVSFNTSGLYEFELSDTDVLDIVLNKTSNNTNTVDCLIVNATSGSINITCTTPTEFPSVPVVSGETTPSAVSNDTIATHGIVQQNTTPSALSNDSVTTHGTVQQNTSSVINNSTEKTTPTAEPTTGIPSLPDRNVQLIVIGSAAAGGVFLVVLVVVIIVICRRKNNDPIKSSVASGANGVSGGSYIDSTLQMSVSMPRPYDTYGRQFTSHNKSNVNGGSDDVMQMCHNIKHES